MKSKFILIVSLIFFIFSCKENTNQADIEPLILKENISGYIQKGPFLNGSSIDIFELKKDLEPTGKVFSAQIKDNSGAFVLNNLSVKTPYLLLKSNGFYFNEVTGLNSISPITLYGYADVSNKSTINVNVLTHLEKSRIEYLISKGSSFLQAKSQAEQEIIRIFSIKYNNLPNSDSLNISQDGEGNAILLSLSILLQGFRSESELSELLADISSDITSDGILNNTSIGVSLINDANNLNLVKIRNNVERKYLSLNMDVKIANFEKYIKYFIDNSKFVPSNQFTFPEFGNHGENILYGTKTVFGSNLSMAALIEKGSSLTIKIKNNTWYYQFAPNGPVNWIISNYDSELKSQEFKITESNKNSDLKMSFEKGYVTLEYYKNNSNTFYYSKNVLIE